MTAGRAGPSHRDLHGRKADKASAYDFRLELRTSAVRQDEAALDTWLANPEQWIAGQRMGCAASNGGERGDAVAYGRRVSKS